MASTYSPSLRLELMATGDQSGTWGDTTNTNLGTLLEQSITGYLAKAMADADQTLTNLNGASDEARNMVVEATGALTAGRNIVVPTAEKIYLIKNSTTGGFAVTVKTTAGTGVAVAAGTSEWVYCDGTNVVQGLVGYALLGAANTFTGANTFSVAQTFTDTLVLTSTNGGAVVGPVLDLYRNSATPTTNDILGRVLFNGEDTAGNTQEYASIEAVIADATSTSEDGALDFYATVAGTRTRIMSVGPNLDLAAIGQIKFPATANLSTNANTLDDYQEGTTTPAITVGSGALADANATCKYTIIGNTIHAEFIATITNNGTGATSLRLGLPFTCARSTSIAFRESGITGQVYSAYINTAVDATLIFIATSANGYPGANGAVFQFGITYFI